MAKIREYTHELQESNLPRDFKHQILESTEDAYVIRSNLKTISDIDKWICAFSKNTNTQWNMRNSRPNGKTKIYKQMVCHHSSFMKVDKCKNKRGISKNADCNAKIRVSIQILSRRNRTSPFMKANLWATISISKKHTHSLCNARTLRFLQDKQSSGNEDDNIRQVFYEYFLNDMNASQAKNYHLRQLELRNATKEELANGRVNPTNDTIQYWYKAWRNLNLTPRSEPQLIAKLEEKKEISFVDVSSITTHDRCTMAKVALAEKKTPDISCYDDFIVEINPDQEIARSLSEGIETLITESNDNDDVDFFDSGDSNSNDDETETDQLTKEIVELTGSILQTFAEKIKNHKYCVELSTALKQFQKRLNDVTTDALLLQFLRTAGTERLKTGARITVQPTALNRRTRSDGINATRSSRGIAAGRITKEDKKMPKIKPNFRYNVAMDNRN